MIRKGIAALLLLAGCASHDSCSRGTCPTPALPGRVQEPCSTPQRSLDAELTELNARDRVLCERIESLQTQRKGVLRLITAIEQYERRMDTGSAQAVAKARELDAIAK